MFGQLANRESLSDLIVALDAHRSKCYHLGLGKNISKSSLARANQDRDYRIFEEKAFYDILVDTRNKHEFEYSDEKCIDLARKIKELIDSSAMYADWINNNNIRNCLKNELIKLLYYNGYPPKWSADIFEKVLAQVENYKKNN